MSAAFLKILNMSISAGWIVLAVLLLRLVLKKAPKWMSVLLWAVVAVRLICPFSLESALSLLPSAETVSPNIDKVQVPQINSGVPVIDGIINPVMGDNLTAIPTASANPLQIWIPILSAIWVLGVGLMLAYVVFSYLRVKRRVSGAVLLRDNIYQSEAVISPFVLGLARPSIYLPFGMSEQNEAHVIAHEQAHLRRRDHLWKPLGFLLLSVYWFNPLLWLGYVLLCRDIELACDEKVIKGLDTAARADYSEALLTCSVNRRLITACPLAFGEVGVKQRIKSVLHYKKPAFWIILVAALLLLATAICLLTDPKKDAKQDPPTAPFDNAYTDMEGVYLSIAGVDTTPGSESVSLIWHNDAYYEVIYGDMYVIERETNGEWDSCAVTEYLYSTLPIETLTAGTEQRKVYYLSKSFDISTPGRYRIRVSCDVRRTRLDSDTQKCEMWAMFEVSSGGETYQFRLTEPTFRYATLQLSPTDNTFNFSYSPLSSHWPRGTYEDTGNRIILRTDDGKYQYTFQKQGEDLVFQEALSSPIPWFKHAADAPPEASVPDGALFQRVNAAD